MKKKTLLVVIILATYSISVHGFSQKKRNNRNSPKIQKITNTSERDKFVEDLLAQMTLEEKVGQMNQVGGSFADTGPINSSTDQGRDFRAGKIGSMLNLAGVEGIMQLQKIAVEESRLGIPVIFGLDVIHGMKTIFPIPLAEAASWDMDAIELSARIAALEASAMGVNWTFAPMVDIGRDARWGRVAEGAGEDPYLGSKIAMARIKGFQGDDLSSKNTIAACAKHYSAYGAAIAGRDYNDVDMSLNLLHDVYMPPFKASVDAGVATFMTSFNTLNGVPATANKYLLRDVLKGEWGFYGFVVSDANSVGELIPHGFAANRAEAAELSANAGLDMDMGSNCYHDELLKLVKEGKVSEEYINDAVRRILTIKYDLGLFEDPYKYCDPEREKNELLTPAHLEAARDVARKSIVLLKNSNEALPLDKSVKNLAVIGPLADRQGDMIGCWGAAGEAKDVTTILKGIKSAVSPATNVLYSKGCEVDSKTQEDFSEALEVAAKADKIIMVMGESGGMSGEAQSRAYLDIPGNQEQLFMEIVKLGKPVIVLLTNGRPLTIKEVDKHASAILETWFLGTQAGHAIADVLFGDYNPSGKLPMSFPRTVGQVPLFYSEKPTGRPLYEAPDFWARSKYNDELNSALYPFGFGLSYTTFKYSNLSLNKETMSIDGEIEIMVDVTNTGKRTGQEVVQLYIRDVFASLSQPLKVLKGFEKLEIKPGETKTVSFKLNADDLKFYKEGEGWITEPGDFHVFVGGNSEDLIKAEFALK